MLNFHFPTSPPAAILIAIAMVAVSQPVFSQDNKPTLPERMAKQPLGVPLIVDDVPQQAGEAVGPWQLALIPEKTDYEVGERIDVLVVQRNRSQKPQYTWAFWAQAGMDFEVTDDLVIKKGRYGYGEPWTTNKWSRYRWYLQVQAGRSLDGEPKYADVIVPPGKSLVTRVPLSLLWDMILPATYTVDVKAKLFNPDAKTQAEEDQRLVVKSNKIQIKVHDSAYAVWERWRQEQNKKYEEQRKAKHGQKP